VSPMCPVQCVTYVSGRSQLHIISHLKPVSGTATPLHLAPFRSHSSQSPPKALFSRVKAPSPLPCCWQHVSDPRPLPLVLTAEEIRLLVVQLAEPYHTTVLVAACTGLRVFPRNDIVFDMNFTVRPKAESASIVVHSSGTD
jgi:hypothetical protein